MSREVWLQLKPALLLNGSIQVRIFTSTMPIFKTEAFCNITCVPKAVLNDCYNEVMGYTVLAYSS